MDWTRRKFLASTAVLSALTGCQSIYSDAASDGTRAPTTALQTDTPTEATGTAFQKGEGTATATETAVPVDTETARPTATDSTTETATATEPGENPHPSASLYRGRTIPQTPHVPGSVTPPTGVRFSPADATPVLTAGDVTDYGDVDYVADPFLFVEDGTWHMFFEILNSSRYKDAPIGHATSPDGLEWTYDQVVLSNRKHLSFPLMWKHRGNYYTCPPNGKRVELYRATDFPTDWDHLGTAIDVEYYPHDPTFVNYRGRWWLFTDRGNDAVMVYYNDSLSVDGWTPHPQNPVVTDRVQAARQGGRPIVAGGRLFLYFQDLAAHYGDKIRCYEVTRLTTRSYADQEVRGSPTLEEFSASWANRGMHTFDPWWLGPNKGWRCAVDGSNSETENWTIGIVDVPPQ